MIVITPRPRHCRSGVGGFYDSVYAPTHLTILIGLRARVNPAGTGIATVHEFATGRAVTSMFKNTPSHTFDSRVRLSMLEADWRRIADQLMPEERDKFPDNPLFAINAIAGEFGCELSSISWQDAVVVRFVRRYGGDKMIIKVMVNRELFADRSQLETLLRDTLPGRVAAANDKNTIREYFGPAACR